MPTQPSVALNRSKTNWLIHPALGSAVCLIFALICSGLDESVWPRSFSNIEFSESAARPSVDHVEVRKIALPQHIFLSVSRFFTSALIAISLGLSFGVFYGTVALPKLLRRSLLTSSVSASVLLISSSMVAMTITSLPSFVVVCGCLTMWPMVWILSRGIRSIPLDYLHVACVLRLSPWTTFLKVLLPATWSSWTSGVRLTLTYSWIVIVVAEMVAEAPGYGSFLVQSARVGNFQRLFLGVATLGLIGYAGDQILGFLQFQFAPVSTYA